MNITPLIEAGPIITGHALAALTALLLGLGQLALPKGTVLHKTIGYVWITLMAGVALSSFFIHDLRLIGPFSPIHALSVYTLFSLVYSIRTARAGNIKAHRATMRSLFFVALIAAGAFTLLPGRVMHAVVFAQ